MPTTAIRAVLDRHCYSRTLPGKAVSARSARTLIREALEAWKLGEFEHTAALIVSELVGNAVVHTASRRIRVSVSRPAIDRVRISVSDKSVRQPEPGRPERDDGGGRGLLIVEAMASRWGSDRRRWGKVVWAEIHTPIRPSDDSR
ncbi:hypothetical protein GCM10010387_18920 [Streptomyces inusitatus]|uniref:Histidine kinase/HSP90-like ATPase domain-containing protein n=1 Tax=Streptomyces inusitatus TaxID=68221 RepID=A0A918UP45_9ACTN|nr:ATP-binding protein [Streptomyces inusitatus]GGZ25587.1 hypothetical protein GCM10010387_18920 [Streptomyces inusitatus]